MTKIKIERSGEKWCGKDGPKDDWHVLAIWTGRDCIGSMFKKFILKAEY